MGCIDLCCRHCTLHFTQCMLVSSDYTGSRKDIMELVKQYLRPCIFDIGRSFVIRYKHICHCIGDICLTQSVLSEFVCTFDPGLCGIAS